MKKVAPLRYDVIFKKAFSVPEIFTAFVRDLLGIDIEIDVVEKDKAYSPSIGSVATKFDLYAEDKKNRVIVYIQHVRSADHYHRFLHYHCIALLEQVVNSDDYHPKVFMLVVLTSGDRHKKDISITDFDPKDLQGKPFGEIDHKIVYICPKYLDKKVTPKQCHEWLEAINDSMDEQVDESHYTLPEIKRIFNLIEKDKVTPEERARMFDEHSEEEIKQEGFKEGLKEAKKMVKQAEEKAKQQVKESAARHLKALNVLSDEQIASATGLSLESVKAL
ncbi:hypothetical protein PN36_33225 [Candidatus Thiomargarita nelsonii]|uniref:Transposase (putative) YhgA-like domain-containing protein n=1 Tax=Candidatus Thiomargarita nelsonii TaxID=1003181 RepID=A0A4E0RL94_9GAMM|nr:hypothetical protein PN36_33225 [Candidatus Thiomargarita nelsonii]